MLTATLVGMMLGGVLTATLGGMLLCGVHFEGIFYTVVFRLVYLLFQIQNVTGIKYP